MKNNQILNVSVEVRRWDKFSFTHAHKQPNAFDLKQNPVLHTNVCSLCEKNIPNDRNLGDIRSIIFPSRDRRFGLLDPVDVFDPWTVSRWKLLLDSSIGVRRSRSGDIPSWERDQFRRESFYRRELLDFTTRIHGDRKLSWFCKRIINNADRMSQLVDSQTGLESPQSLR